MLGDHTSSFDPGPLTWVKPEIDQALTRGITALQTLITKPDDRTPLKHAQTHIHQAVGALSIVGIDAIAPYTEEIEKNLLRLENVSTQELTPAVKNIIAACNKLISFLQELASGARAQALQLFSEYETLQKLRSVERVSPTDLFFPDLSPRAPKSDTAKQLSPQKLTSHLLRQRRNYQLGILSWLRGQEGGLEKMQQAVQAVEDSQTLPAQRAFWWSAGALLESIPEQSPPHVLSIKFICARIDLQIRRLAEGSNKVADRLRREVLYYVAMSAPTTERIKAVQTIYRLRDYLPSPDHALSAEWLSQQPLIRECRELLNQTKEHWLRATGGRSDSAAALEQSLAQLKAKAVKLPVPALPKVIDALGLSAREAAVKGSVGETLAIEYATALLLLESALDPHQRPSAEFPRQAEAMAQRLEFAVRDLPPPADITSIALLDEMARKAQERLLLTQVAREIKSNLRHIEQVLDTFFRDHKERKELGGLASYGKQIQGAFTMLGLAEATELIKLCQEQIAHYANPATIVQEKDIDLLAESLSGLGFYIEAVEQQRSEGEALIRRLLRRQQGLPEETPAIVEEETVEAALDEQRKELAPLLEAIQDQPQDSQARAELKQQLEAVKHDADLIADAKLSQQTAAALDMLEQSDAAPTEALTETIQQIAGTQATQAPAPSAEAIRLLSASAETLDRELFEIYLTEAEEVLSNIAGQLEILRQQLHDSDALRTIRRGFHTLKGSGRMVGLHGLGDLSWGVERRLNKWLEEERAATPTLIHTIEIAHRSFTTWIHELRTTNRLQADPVELDTALHDLDAALGISSGPAAPAATLILEKKSPESALNVVEPPLSEAETALPVIENAAIDDDILIGELSLSKTLYQLLIDESAQHLADLKDELKFLQAQHNTHPSDKMIRASHTLCGIHRTAGLSLLAETAYALEQGLSELQHHDWPLTQIATLSDAIALLEHMAQTVRERKVFSPEQHAAAQAIQQALQQLVIAATPRDSETQAQQTAIQEEAETQLDPGPPVIEALTAEQHALPIDPLADVHDDVDEQLLSVFLEEAHELFPLASEQLRSWRRSPQDIEAQQGLQRTLHTFKGSARMAGAMRLGQLTHLMESRLLVADGLVKPSAQLFDALDNDLDHLAYVLDRLQKGERNTLLPGTVAEEATADTGLADVVATVETPAAKPTLTLVSPPQVSLPEPITASAVAAKAPAAEIAEFEPVAESVQRALLRVRADVIDRLVNEAGEISIARSRVEGELRTLKANLLELTNNVIRMRNQVREIEIQAESQIQSRLSVLHQGEEGFDPLEFDRFTRFQELTRSLAEGVNDVSTVQQALLKNLDDAETALLTQARLNRDVQQELLNVRTVPFGSLSERLYRIVRQSAKELNKKANLEIAGTQVELDRSVLEKLVGPLEHILRNAIDHGLEDRAARSAAGKAEIGEIVLKVQQIGNEVVISLTDDGAGMDFARIKEKAHRLGLLPATGEPTPAQLIECTFAPGFSTAAQVTQLSGRGIGMDVVRNEIAALGGRVEVTTHHGKGTSFIMTLPLTLAVAQVVLVQAGGRLFALPAQLVEQVQQTKAEGLINLYVSHEVQWQGHTYPFFYLPRLLGDDEHNPDTLRYNAIVLMRSGAARTAIHVDKMLGNQEVVIKNIGTQLARVTGIAGATVLGTGEVVLIINPVQLAQRLETGAVGPSTTPPLAEAGQRSGVVLVVDDSLTVRKMTSRLLIREGFEVMTAKDGLDAIQAINETVPDIILLDIEMPRMDGFEFAKTIKVDVRSKHIPIIMITSRTAEKHRARADELGIDVYLGKPYQEEELLGHIKRLTI